MNKAELIEAVADATDTSKAEASRTLDAVLDSISGAQAKEILLHSLDLVPSM